MDKFSPARIFSVIFILFLAIIPFKQTTALAEEPSPGKTAAEKKSFLPKLQLRGSLQEDKFRDYVPPISSPLQNETPYITTEIRPIFWLHKIPKKSLVGNGEVYLAAAQARIALTDRLGIIATKDGLVWVEPKKTLEDDFGFANLAGGLKYAFISSPKHQALLTGGITFEAPTGKLDLNGVRFQGNGNGILNLFLTGEKRFGKLGIQSSFGGNIPMSTDYNSTTIHYHGHLDYEVFKNFFPTFEYNGYTVVHKGNIRPLNFEGVDVFNFGNHGGGTVQTMAAGFRFHINKHWQIGTAWEWAVGHREDLIDWRYQADMVFSF